MKTRQKQLFRWPGHWASGLRMLAISRVAALTALLTIVVAAHADRMNDNNYFSMTKEGDHLHFTLQMADAYSNNTYCDWGGIIASSGGQEVEVMIIFSGDDDDDGSKWGIHAKDRNGSNWGGVSFITNTYPSNNRKQVEYQSGDYTPSIDIMKRDLYPKVEIDFYWPASMSGKTWSFKYAFNHVRNSGKDGGWKTMNLGSTYLGNSPVSFGYASPDIKGYTYSRERMDKMKITVPELPGNVPSHVSSNRWYESDYEFTAIYTMPSNTTKVVRSKTLNGKVGEKKTFEVEIPDSVQGYKKMDLSVKATARLKNVNGANFWSDTYNVTHTDVFANAPFPKNLVTEYRQYDDETVLAWEAFSTGERYIRESVPYVYCIETNASGTPLSGQQWLKRDVLKQIGTQLTQSYTDQSVPSGKYFRYMVLNVPQEWVDKGISTNDLNSPTEKVLARLPYTQSDVVSTAPDVDIFGLQQDTAIADKVRLTWQYSRVPGSAQTVEFQVMRRTTADGAWTSYGTVTADSKPAAGTVVSFEDSNLPDSKTRYEYKIVLDMNNGAYRFESDPLTAGFLQGTMIKNLQASKGTHDATVRVTWNTKQIGTANSTYVLSRRYAGSTDEFMQIHTAHGTAEQYVYEDNTALPGYYYEYKVGVYGGDDSTLQNVLTDVGFCQARGVVSGAVNFGTGVAVKNVRLNLTTSDDDSNAVRGYSKRIDGASTGMTWEASAEAVNRLFGPDRDFTVQMFVRPDEGLGEGAVVAQIPGENKVILEPTDSGNYKLAVVHPHYVDPVYVDPVIGDSVYVAPVDIPPVYQQEGSVVNLSDLRKDYEAKHGDILTGTLRGNYRISIAPNASVKLRDVTINGVNSNNCKWPGITCPGNATIVLEGVNYVRGFYENYPGIYIDEDHTLTITGTGNLDVNSNGYAPGIGSIYKGSNCGNINIEGGDIVATGGAYSAAIGGSKRSSCGNITITGGKIKATGGSYYAAAIGGGDEGSCGSITITRSVTQVVAVKGSNILGYAQYSIGAGDGGKCGPVTINGTTSIGISSGTEYFFTGDGTWELSYQQDEIFNPKLIAEGYTIPGHYVQGDTITPGYTIDGYYTLKPETAGVLPSNVFSLLTLSRSGDNYCVQVNGDEPVKLPALKSQDMKLFSVGGAEGITDEQAFRGNISEVRVFDHALSESERSSYFDRTLNGRENGLRLYWPMDEGLDHYVFDASYANDVPNSRHATVGVNVSTSSLLPTKAQLSRYGITNDQGEYIIRGIPFAGSGTSYRVVPELGIHEFSPTLRSMFISPSSITANNVDFEDVSSFPMEGYIYYAGTNVPAEGIQMYIDNELVTANGEVKQTNANGHYRISVPIGNHYVEARLKGHTMVGGGRFPTEGTFNFDRAVTYDFADSTLVNFVGRVGGGERNDTLAVGFGASKNNIGMATVELRLNNDSFSFNCASDHILPATAVRIWESDTIAIRSRAWTKTGDDSRSISIRTDSLTGEFSALLPPLKYTIKSVSIDSIPDLKFSVGQEVDLTNVLAERSDSLTVEGSDGTTNKLGYKYNTKKVFTYFAPPQLSVVDTGADPGFYGLKTITFPAQLEGEQPVVIEDLYQEGRTPRYLVDYPIYQMGQTNKYNLFGYEVYENHDDANKVVTDTIPLPHVNVTVTNEMSSEQVIVYDVMDESTGYKPGQPYDVTTKQIPLDDNGRGELKWTAGFPNITAPYTRKFSVSLERRNRTYNVADIDAIVLGHLTYGNNFVTRGPDIVNFVLRDPQGAKSTTKLTKGSITTTTIYDTRRAYGDYEAVFTIGTGANVKEGKGVGLIVITETDAKTTTALGDHTTWEKTWNKDSLHVVTKMTNVSTSDSKPYVGAPGDVYIGTSTNFLIGGCRRLFIEKNQATNKFELKTEDALAFGDSITTAFKYSQYELENVMIPKWKDMRRSFLTEVASEEVAKSYVNLGKNPVYLTWVGLNEDSYEDGKNYIYVKPESWKTNGLPSSGDIDSLNWCNNQIKTWEKYIRENEEDKVRLMESIGKGNNISIDGGSSYSYSHRKSGTKHDETTINWKMGLVLGEKLGISNMHFATVAHSIEIKTETGGGYIDGGGTITEDFTEWEYNIEDGNRDTDLSLTIYESDNDKYSDFFSVFGGQTYNPYQEQEMTHYHKDKTGNYVPLGNSTVQMEQPDMRIGLPGENTSKSVTVTDIPAGGEAIVMLQCTNLANAHQGIDFSYDIVVLDETNTKGLQILMDGVPINGRSLYLGHGETVSKVITIRQTDQSILDYEGIKLWFASQYQPATIHDEVTLNAHFKPSSSPISLVIQEPVLNTATKNGELQMRLTGFNRQFKNLKNVGVQYRFEGNTQWTNLHTWVIDKADSTGTSFSMLPTTGDIRWPLNMENNLSYPEGRYEFRAYTTTPYDTELVQVYSDAVAVIKDLTRPRNLYTPAPANGILSYGDQLAIEFNEDIVSGYVGDKNVIVTAKLNHQPVTHEVSLFLVPFGTQASTVNPVFLNGDFSMDFWLNCEEAGTILHQSEGVDNFSLSIDADGHAVVSIAGMTFTSSKKVPFNKWVYYAINYKASEMKFNLLAQYDTENLDLFVNEQLTQQELKAVNYTDDNRLYLGPISARIHDLSLYNIFLDVHEAAANKYQAKDNYVYGLVNYWPMNEGHGSIAADTRHTHDFEVPQSWTIENTNYAMRIDNAEGAQVDITRINTSKGDSYAIELWSRLSQVNGEVVFETGTPTVEGDLLPQSAKLRLRYDDQKNLVFDYGTHSQIVARHEDFPDLSGWQHMALNVVRGQAASFYLNGQRTAVIAESDVPTIQGTKLTVAKGAILNGVDELRIWKATLSEGRLLSNMYNTIDTTDVYSRGLVAYYPFEKAGTVNGVTTKVETLENMAPGGADTDISTSEFYFVRDTAPLKNAPDETRLIASPVASERKVVINLSGSTVSARDIEGTTLNITLADIRDLHGNTSNPIKWTAYVQQNTLKWTRDSVNIIKNYGAGYTFDVDIENKGGQTEYYTLYNMPQWLSLVESERSDDAGALKTKTLRFKVNPLVAVGNYDVTIGLQGNKEILEPLRIVMKVRGEKPDWTVDPTKYDHNMSIIGQVYIGGILMENPESMVAAFIGGECRGVAQPQKVRGAAYVTMTVYGDDVETRDHRKTVSFRIWDASKGVAYTDAQLALDGAAVDVTFAQDQMIGNFDSPAIWTKTDKVEQLIPVHENWNWIGFGVEPESHYLDHIFGSYAEWMMLIKDRETFSDYNGAEWNGTLTPAVNKMYKLKVSRLPRTQAAAPNAQLSVSGRQPSAAEMPVMLKNGWNWIAYTPLTTMTVQEALAGANPRRGDIVKSQTGVAIYGNDEWEGNLLSLESGHGYLYYSADSQQKQFVYPVASSASSRTMAPLRATGNGPRIFKPVDTWLYPNNMTMVIQLRDGENVVDTAEVAAFIGDECRGATRADSKGLYYLIISGDGSGQPMTLRTCVNGGIVTIDEALTFVSDNNIGTSWEPYVIDLKNLSSGINDITADEDDNGDWWTLQGYKIGRHPTRSGVYIHHGEKVTVRRKP